MRKLIKKVLGLDKLEESITKAETELAEANKRLEEAEKAKMAPKDRATKLKEPWVGVLETHVNKDNIRNGFFELDWNEYFVLKLRQRDMVSTEIQKKKLWIVGSVNYVPM